MERVIIETGRVRGPVFTVPNGVELPVLSFPKQYDLVIMGIKNPPLADALHKFAVSLGLRTYTIIETIAKDEWFEIAASSRIALTLPHATEGFYLPALEAMHFSDLVIVPDCIGNRDFCRHLDNCLMPEYSESGIEAAIQCALTLPSAELRAMQSSAKKTVNLHSLENERRAFLAVMDTIDTLWQSIE